MKISEKMRPVVQDVRAILNNDPDARVQESLDMAAARYVLSSTERAYLAAYFAEALGREKIVQIRQTSDGI